jgi:ATP-binding cassette subfamily C exporter for protease/lipase
MTILRQWLTGQGALAYFDLPWSPIYLAVMFMLHPFLGVMALVFMAVLAAFAWWTTAATAATGEAVEEREQELDAFVHGKLRNAEVIEAHGMVPGLLSRWSAYQSKCVALHVSAHSLEERFTVTSKELRMLMQSLAIGGAALLAIRGEISFGAMIAASLLIGRATSPIDQLVAGWRQFISAKQALRRLRALLQTPMTRGRAVLDAADPVAVQLCSVSASAPGRKDPILHELSATFPGGKIYAVMGDSGAGKSTLGKVILGIWPEVKGSVLYQGRDAKELDRVAIGPHLGYLPQDIELFPATVAENIARMGKPDPDKVIEAARMTGTHEMILRLPMGYDTPIGEAGSALSGGQRQRVALARAIYGTPRLIVLDEPNANLDDAGEKALAEVLEQLKDRGSTVFLITHRHNVVRLADQLLFMRAGRIEKFGPVSPILQDLAAKRQLSGAASGVKSTPINTPELGETSVDG